MDCKSCCEIRIKLGHYYLNEFEYMESFRIYDSIVYDSGVHLLAWLLSIRLLKIAFELHDQGLHRVTAYEEQLI
ncbi:hypothetical protein P8452_35560 [Trifolium repens]|nr:hypothetical protein P8452_35560 [Trifolium repens]